MFTLAYRSRSSGVFSTRTSPGAASSTFTTSWRRPAAAPKSSRETHPIFGRLDVLFRPSLPPRNSHVVAAPPPRPAAAEDLHGITRRYESNSISRHKGIYHGSNIHDAAQKIHVNRTWEQKHFNYKPTKTPRAWPEINSGVMVYRSNDRSKELVENWLANYIDDCRFVNFSLDITSGQDQPTFRTSLFDAVTTGMRFYPLPPIWNTRAWRPNLTGMDYYHKKPYEANCCFDGTVVAAGREHKDLPRKQVSIILDHKCLLPAAVADYEGGPRYINATAKREQYPKELPNH